MNRSPRILVVGVPTLALSLPVGDLPAPGQTAPLFAHPAFFPGDRGTRLAAALARLGVDTYFAGTVGRDVPGQFLRAALAEAEVHTDYLRTSEDGATATDCRLGTGPATRTLCYPGAGSLFDTSRIEEAFACHPEGVCLGADLPPEVLTHLIRYAHAQDVPVLTEARGGGIRLGDLPESDLFLCNEDECEALVGVRPGTADKSLSALLTLSSRIPAAHHVLKLGERGCFFVEGRMPRYMAACNVETPVGTEAGTVFAAALTLFFVQSGGNLSLSCKFANAAAALALSAPGSYLPTRDEVASFLREI